jgi:hypothetical protein
MVSPRKQITCGDGEAAMAITSLRANHIRTKEVFASVPSKTTSSRLVIPVRTFDGLIEAVRVFTENPVKFNITLYQKLTAVKGDTDTLLISDTNTQTFQISSRDIWYVQEGILTPVIYAEVENEGNIATGEITIELFVQSGEFGGNRVLLPG